jgi:NAD-dependent deacetylase
MKIRDEFVKKLKEAKSVVVFTGAGISAESGIPTFRGKDGLWNKLKPEELANFSAFLQNPDMVWEWYQHRKNIIHQNKPNPAHYAIAGMEKYYKKFTVITQNVDNLHTRAGSSKVLELHGNIERNFCVDCGKFDFSPEVNESVKVPKCRHCGGLIRPDVVWFGEMLPQDVFAEAERCARTSDILIVIGTSAVVYPAAYIPLNAKSGGAYLVEINLEETELSGSVDYSIRGKAGEIMPVILEKIKAIK